MGKIQLNQTKKVMETLIAFIALFATVFGILYVHYTTRNKERMALIEKGADASLFNTGKEGKSYFNWGKFALKTGMLFMGIGLGIIAGAILESAALFPSEEAGYFSMIFIFGGLALVLYYLIDRKTK
jgi:F0F1-type ATP synthase membrane subunit c/vacuolar-type H+-ATPase subunit K